MQIPNILTSFSPNFFLTIFLVKSKLSTAKKSQTAAFFMSFHLKQFGKSKLNFWTKNEDFEQCVRLTRVRGTFWRLRSCKRHLTVVFRWQLLVSRYLGMKLNVSVSYLCCFKPFVKFALRRFLLRWQHRELADKKGRWLSRSPLRARFNSFAVHLSLLSPSPRKSKECFPLLTDIFATP